MSKQNRLKSRAPGKSLHLGRNITLLPAVHRHRRRRSWPEFYLFETEKPLATIGGNIEFLGKTSEIPFTVADRKSGLRSVVMTIEQDGRSSEILSRRFPRQSWLQDAGPAVFQEKALFDISKSEMKEGPAEIVITARDFSLNGFFTGNSSELRQPVVIDTQSPRVILQHSQRYIQTRRKRHRCL